MVRNIPPAWLSRTIARVSLRNAREFKRARTFAIHSLERLQNRITPTTLSLPATQDDTLYAESGDLSNGVGQYFYAGQVAASPPKRGNSADRRAVIEFNVASIATSLPAGSTINSVTLVLHLSKSADKTNAHSVEVHELTTAWTEGASNAGTGGVGPSEGDGIQAKTGDATWSYSSYKTAQWQSAGGDIVAAASNIQSVGPFNQSLELSATNKTQGNLYRWNVTSDVMQMLLHPATNDGWILIGDEGSLSAMQFDSRQVQASPPGGGIAAIAPQLVIDYNTPPSISQISLPPWTVGRPYAQVIQASGGTGSYTFSSAGLVDGLVLAPNGTFSGTPTSPGSFQLNVTVRDSAGGTSTASLPFTINNTPSLGALSQNLWTVNQALKSVTIPIVGGTPNFASPAALSAQPGGLTAKVTGNTITITGAPAAMASSITVTVTDAAGATANRTLPITVNPPVAQTFYVNSALDAPSLGAHDPAYDSRGDISLRSAIMAASDDGFGTQAVTDTIVVPADDYFLFSTLTISGNMNIIAAPGIAPAKILILGESNTDMIDVTRGHVSIAGVEISNASSASTAGIFNTGATLAVANCLFSGNNTSAIANESILSIANSIFKNNTTQFSGGAVVNFNGTATIDDSTFNLNTANHAGAVYNGFGRMTIRGTTFVSNMTTVNSGGAVENDQGVLTVADSTFASNSSAFNGGAISSTGPLTVVASTFTLNGAAGQGGGIYSIYRGLYFVPSTLLVDDLLDGNYGASLPAFVDDFTGNGLLAASHNNLIGACYNGVISSGTNGNQLNVSLADAGLAPLGYYGGATQTIDLQPNSLAIGRGGAVASLATNAIDPNATSLLVNNGMVFAAASLPVLTSGSYFTIQISGDEMAVTGVQLNADGTATLTVTRGVNNASGPHLAGAGVFLATDQTGLTPLIGAPTDVGAFQSWVPLQVNTAADDNSLVGPGELSLREAVNRANQNSASTTTFIAFDPAVFADATTISLSSDLTFGTPRFASNIKLFAPVSGLEIASATSNAMHWVVVSAGSTVALAGDFTLSTTLDVQGQSYGLPGGIFRVSKTGTLHATQGIVLVDGTFSAEGQTEIDDLVDFIVNTDGVFNIGNTSRAVTINGILDVFGAVVLQSGFTDTDGNEVYGGLLNVYGDLKIEQFGSLTDGGTLVVEAADIFGKLAILPAFTDTSGNEQAAGYLQIFFGTVNISPTATVTDAGTIANGYFNVDTAATLNIQGLLSISQSSVDTNGVSQPAGFLDDFGVVNVGVTGSHQGTLNDAGQLTIESGGKLTDGNLVAVFPNGNVDIFGTFATIQSPAGPGSPGVLYIFSSATVTVEAVSGPSNSPGWLDDGGQVTVDTIARLTDMGNVTVESQGVVSDQSRFLVTGAGASLSVNAGGVFTINSDSRLAVNQFATATILGELDVNSLCEVIVDTGGGFDLSGKLAIGQLGSLDVAATGGTSGNFTVEPSGNLTLSNRGDISVEGFFAVASGGVVTVIGEFTVAAGGTVLDSGIFSVTGVTSDLEVANADDTLGYGNFTVEAVFGASLSISQMATATIDGMLDVEGKASVSGGATLTDTANVLIGGSLDVAGATPNSLAGTLSATGGSTLEVKYGGITTIEGNFTNTSAILEINGTFVESTLTVGPYSVLDGDGSLPGAVIVDSGGIDLPGYYVGVLSTGSLTLTGGSSFNAVPSLPAQDNVTGRVSLNGATLNFIPTSNFTPTAGYQYLFINNDGADAVSGNFVAGAGVDAVAPGTVLHEGDVLSTDFLGTGRTARITYKAGSGHNSVALTLSPMTPTIDSAPANPSNSTTATFTFSDVDSGVTFLTSLDSTVLLPSPSPAVYSGLRPGLHTFQVAAVDSNGNRSAIASYSFVVNTDTTPPASAVNTSLSVSPTLLISGSVFAADPGINASGVASVAVYVAVDSGAFSTMPIATLTPVNLSFSYQGSPGHHYFFRSIATDNANNVETKTTLDAATYIAIPAPVSSVASAIPNTSNATFIINITGTDAYGPGIASFSVYAAVNSGSGYAAPVLVGTVNAGSPDTSNIYRASLTYQAAADGVARSYEFFSVGTDTANRVEPMHATPDLAITQTFAQAPLAFIGLTIQHGAAERSFVEFVDLDFNEGGAALTNFYNALVANPNNNVQLLDGVSGMANNQAVSLSGVKFSLDTVHNLIELDFGSLGLGGVARGNLTLANYWKAMTAADGWYETNLDMTGTGNFNSASPHGSFGRLLGDSNGDGTVDQNDVNLVAQQLGQAAPALAGDLNGDGLVDSSDTYLVGRSKGRSLGSNPFH